MTPCCNRPRTPVPSLRLLLLSLFQLLCFMIPHASPLSFNYSIFNQDATGDLTSYEDATLQSNAIQLTRNQMNTYLERSMGSVVHNEPVHLWDKRSGKLADFTSNFSFTIDGLNKSRSADGIAFFLSSYPYYNETFNHSWGGALGLFDRNGTNMTRNKIVAVEFDSYINPEYNDSSANHVGIDIHRIVSVAHVELNTSIRQKAILFASVCYNASTRNLSVFLSNSSDPRRNWSLSYGVDLRDYLPEKVVVGFSASTGDLYEVHTIFSWSFSSKDLGLRHKRSKALEFAIPSGILVGLFCAMFFIRKYMRKKVSRNMAEDEDTAMDVLVGDAIERASGPRRFPYSLLLSATHNFARERKLGEGGFGEVYMGVLHDPKLEVAIKRFSKDSKQGKREYISEITTISQLRHRHLVQLIGYCHERGDLLLVYEYMLNRSLDYHLYGKDRFLTWPVRYKIALGLASALLYLHEEWQQCIIHRDVKPSNVMLDSEFNAKLGDFGLARLMDHDCNPLTTVLMGTRGYIAPEYAVTGKPSKESDVYSFGVVILEIACGRKPIIEDKEMKGKVNLVQWVWELYGRKMCLTAADERLKMEFDEQQMERLMVVGLWCAHPASDLRPSIRQVIHVLEFDAPVPNLPPKMPVPVYCPPSGDLFNPGSTSSDTYSASSWSISGR
ncbi:L-type lectin-domain containing receptor kinase IX.1-like [Phoenix dactylifera]|uniref:non-specific serine/threonine protein kinase n=1 Tax=Phoenix dactylifera TaxID=42345 RepID=A0A8B7D236_PHODC|nr:L-type lectin-domain containing receptor kinase IX.1-like [Phoenix dactylifera]